MILASRREKFASTFHIAGIGEFEFEFDWQFYRNGSKRQAVKWLDSISSRFNVLNMPISTTAPIDAKTQNPLTNQRSLFGNMRRFLIGCRLLRA
jgi:hypothetical protein